MPTPEPVARATVDSSEVPLTILNAIAFRDLSNPNALARFTGSRILLKPPSRGSRPRLYADACFAGYVRNHTSKCYRRFVEEGFFLNVFSIASKRAFSATFAVRRVSICACCSLKALTKMTPRRS